MTIKTERGSIVTTKEIGNELAGFLYEAEDSLRRRGRKHLANRAKEIADLLFDNLDSEGYYK